MKMNLSSPIEQFLIWFQEAQSKRDPSADLMALATSTADGKPSIRIVLFKGISQDGFVFYTNYQSRKGAEIAQNPNSSIVFYWPSLDRQVRVEGTLEKVSAEESDQYFRTRPRGSQIGAWASSQSQILTDRKELEEKLGVVQERFSGIDVARPGHWGGYRLKPEMIEFWQGREDRLHERLRYQRQGNGWKTDLLYP